MESRAGRAVRGWIVAVVATLLAAVSHGIADGSFPSLLGLGASLVLAGAACTILTPRGQSLWRLAVAVAATQVGFHTLFSTLGSGAVAAGTTGHDAGHGSAALNSALAEAASAAHGHASMTLAHIVAGILTLILLRNAESAAVGLARVVRLVVRRLLRPVDAPVPVASRRSAPAATHLPSPQALRALSPDRYRGPPVCAHAV